MTRSPLRENPTPLRARLARRLLLVALFLFPGVPSAKTFSFQTGDWMLLSADFSSTPHRYAATGKVFISNDSKLV